MQYWQLQKAKNQFSELVDKAARLGPQMVTRLGKEAAVVLSYNDYKKLTQHPSNIVDFLKASPLAGVSLDFGRSRDPSRKIEL